MEPTNCGRIRMDCSLSDVLVSIIIPALDEPYLDSLKEHIKICFDVFRVPYEILVQEEIGKRKLD